MIQIKTLLLFSSLLVNGMAAYAGLANNLSYCTQKCEFASEPTSLLTFVPYNKITGDYDKIVWIPTRRDVGVHSMLPSVSLCGDVLTFFGGDSIDRMDYQIVEPEGVVVCQGQIAIEVEKEHLLKLTQLPPSNYLLILTIGDESFAAEFDY